MIRDRRGCRSRSSRCCDGDGDGELLIWMFYQTIGYKDIRFHQSTEYRIVVEINYSVLRTEPASTNPSSRIPQRWGFLDPLPLIQLPQDPPHHTAPAELRGASVPLRHQTGHDLETRITLGEMGDAVDGPVEVVLLPRLLCDPPHLHVALGHDEARKFDGEEPEGPRELGRLLACLLPA